MTRLERLRKQLADLEAQQENLRTSILALADVDGDLTPEQDEQYRSANTEFDVLPEQLEAVRTEITALERVASTPARATEPVGLTVHVPNTEDSLRFGAEFQAPQAVMDTARRALDKGVIELADKYRSSAHGVLSGVHGDPAAVARHLIATGREAYRTAFSKMFQAAMRNQPVMGLSADEVQAVEHVRASSLTDAAGGFAVPFTLDPTIILTGAHDGAASPFRRIARVVQTTTDSWNGVTSAGVSASWDDEVEEVSDDAPTLAQPSIPVNRLRVFVPFSMDIQGDWATMESDLRSMISIAKDDKEAAAFIAATAVAKAPTGLIFSLDGTDSELSPAVAETFAYGDISKPMDELAARHAANGTWLAHVSTFNKIKALAAATGDTSIWSHTDAAAPALLLGRPALQEPGMRGFKDVDADETEDNFILLFGDFRKYVIADRVGLSVELVPHLFGTAANRPNGQRGLFAWARVGGEVVDTDAFRVLNVATTAA